MPLSYYESVPYNWDVNIVDVKLNGNPLSYQYSENDPTFECNDTEILSHGWGINFSVDTKLNQNDILEINYRLKIPNNEQEGIYIFGYGFGERHLSTPIGEMDFSSFGAHSFVHDPSINCLSQTGESYVKTFSPIWVKILSDEPTTTTIQRTTTTQSGSTTTIQRTTTTQSGSTTTIQNQCNAYANCRDCIKNNCEWCGNPSFGYSGCKDYCTSVSCFGGNCYKSSCPTGVTTTTQSGETTTTIFDSYNCGSRSSSCEHCLEGGWGNEPSCGWCLDTKECKLGTRSGSHDSQCTDSKGNWAWDEKSECGIIITTSTTITTTTTQPTSTTTTIPTTSTTETKPTATTIIIFPAPAKEICPYECCINETDYKKKDCQSDLVCCDGTCKEFCEEKKTHLPYFKLILAGLVILIVLILIYLKFLRRH